MPVHVVEVLQQLAWARRELTQGLGREPTHDELAARCGLGRERVRHLLSAARRPLSLETPVGGTAVLGDVLEDLRAVAPLEQVLHDTLATELNRALATLEPRQAQVLRLRFGIEGERTHTLEELGIRFDVTRERIRQIEAAALNKLRAGDPGPALRSYADH
jgi:RNA polymerase primary sigma factor